MGTVSYSPSIVTMAVFHAILEIFSVKEWLTLKSGFGVLEAVFIQYQRVTDRQTDRQTDGQTDRQTDRRTDRQTDRIAISISRVSSSMLTRDKKYKISVNMTIKVDIWEDNNAN